MNWLIPPLQYIQQESDDGKQNTVLDVLLARNAAAAEVLLDECISTNDQDLTSNHLLIVYDLEPFRDRQPFNNRLITV
jgi:hypothetical protein